MRVAKNHFIVTVDGQFVKPKIKGLDFFLDTDFHPKLLATKTGVVTCLPVQMSGYVYDNAVEIGDEVVFGHLVCQNDNKVGENQFRCAYHDMYAKIVGEELVPLEDSFFAQPMYEPDFHVGAIFNKGKVSGKYARVIAMSNLVRKAGVELGDVVFFTKNADYEIEVCGKKLFKMHLRNIIGLERNGELKTFRDKILVKNVTKLGSVGGVQKIYAQTSLQHGVVIDGGNTGIEKGAELTYLNSSASAMNWKGEDYAFLKEENIKYIKDMSEFKARPVRDRILVLQNPGDSEVAGFVIPESEKKKPNKGRVVAVGDGYISPDGVRVPMTVKVGDEVVYSRFVTTTVNVEGVDYICVKEGDLELIL